MSQTGDGNTERWPIAPDGYIPNSVIRSWRKKKKKKHLPQMDPSDDVFSCLHREDVFSCLHREDEDPTNDQEDLSTRVLRVPPEEDEENTGDVKARKKESKDEEKKAKVEGRKVIVRRKESYVVQTKISLQNQQKTSDDGRMNVEPQGQEGSYDSRTTVPTSCHDNKQLREREEEPPLQHVNDQRTSSFLTNAWPPVGSPVVSDVLSKQEPKITSYIPPIKPQNMTPHPPKPPSPILFSNPQPQSDRGPHPSLTPEEPQSDRGPHPSLSPEDPQSDLGPHPSLTPEDPQSDLGPHSSLTPEEPQLDRGPHPSLTPEDPQSDLGHHPSLTPEEPQSDRGPHPSLSPEDPQSDLGPHPSLTPEDPQSDLGPHPSLTPEEPQSDRGPHPSLSPEDPQSDLGPHPSLTPEDPQSDLGPHPSLTPEEPQLDRGPHPSLTPEDPQSDLGHHPSLTPEDPQSDRGPHPSLTPEDPQTDRGPYPSLTPEDLQSDHGPYPLKPPSPTPVNPQPQPDLEPPEVSPIRDKRFLLSSTKYDNIGKQTQVPLNQRVLDFYKKFKAGTKNSSCLGKYSITKRPLASPHSTVQSNSGGLRSEWMKNLHYPFQGFCSPPAAIELPVKSSNVGQLAAIIPSLRASEAPTHQRVVQRIRMEDTLDPLSFHFRHVIPLNAQQTFYTLNPGGKTRYGRLQFDWLRGNDEGKLWLRPTRLRLASYDLTRST